MIFGTPVGGASLGAVATTKATALRLQAALVQLGNVVRDSVLMVMGIDGALGGKTVIAVNRAFTTHIGAGQAPAAVRTGKLTLAWIKAHAAMLSGYLEAEVRRRGGVVKLASQVIIERKAALKKVVAKKVVAKKAVKKPMVKKPIARKPVKKPMKVVGAKRKIRTKTGQLVTATPVVDQTTGQQTYEVEKEDGQVVYVQDPTDVGPSPPPPPPPRYSPAVTPTVPPPSDGGGEDGDGPVPSGDGGTPVGPTPDGGGGELTPTGGGFFTQHKLPILIGGGVLVLGLGTMLIMRGRKRSPVMADWY